MTPRYLLAVLLLLASCNQQASNAGPNFHITDSMRQAAIRAYDPAQLDQSLRDIERWHIANKTGIAAALNPGLDDATIDAQFRPLGCKPPKELRQLWKWHNGYLDHEGPVVWLVWYHQFLPLEDALKQYRQLLSEPMMGWNKSWIPVFYFEQEWYFVECSSTEAAASPLMYFFTETGPSDPYVNLTTFMQTQAEAFRTGALALQGKPPGLLDAHLRDYRTIFRHYNPGHSFNYGVEGG